MNQFYKHLQVWPITNYALLGLTVWVFNAGPVLAADNSIKLYRWVDEQGSVHFTDTIPPNAVNLSHEILNSQGVPTEVVERAKTPEEMRQEQETQRLQAESKRLQAEQEASDQVLLRTFRTEDDILMARNGRLDTVDTMIKVAQSSIRHYQTKLTDQQYKQAAALERSAKAVPQALQAEIQDTLQRVSDTYGIIRHQEQDQQAIRNAFDRDLKRFRVLKNLRPAQQVVGDKVLPILDNLIPCGEGAVCDEAWTRAEAFVLKHATTAIQIQGDLIVMAKAPTKDNDVSITISRIVQTGQPTMLFMDLFCKNSPMGHDLCESERVNEIRRAYHREVGNTK